MPKNRHFFTCQKKKRLVTLLIGLILLLTTPGILAETTDEPAEEAVYRKTWLSGPHYGYRREVAASVLSGNPGQGPKTEEEIVMNIRFVPFDSEKGLYATDKEENAGDRVEITNISENRTSFSLRLNEPGKYTIYDTEYYYLDSDVPALTALRSELDSVIIQSAKEKEVQTAQAVHDWIAQRVSPVFTAETESLAPQCTDPLNALITGCAREEAYDKLYDILLGSAGLSNLLVSGEAGGEEGIWCISRLDGAWVWTDMSMDDLKDKKSRAYFAKDEKAFGKDHSLSPADKAFVDRMILENAVTGILDGSLTSSLFQANLTLGEWALLMNDGPSWVVGDSATITYHGLSNRNMEEDKQKPVEQFMREMLYWEPWNADNNWYENGNTLDPEWIAPNPPLPSELVTVEEINEDKTCFTLTFRKPGHYILTYKDIAISEFYLISPEETAVVEMAAEMDKIVEKAKAAPTEKAGAQMIFRWIRSRLKYNYPAWDWRQGKPVKVTERDVKTAWESIGGLIYGKAVCNGYASTYDLMMHQAGMMEFYVGGVIQPSFEGHAWNLNRLDGIWSFTDVTWDRFAWTSEKMSKDHMANMDGFYNHLVFGDAMSYLTVQAKGENKPLAAIPVQLKYLPMTVDGYGFPEKAEFMDVGLTYENERISIKMPVSARILINSQLTRGDPLADWGRKSPVAKEYSIRRASKQFQVELRTDPDLPFAKKATSQWFLINYKEGQIAKIIRRLVIPDKAGTYPGYDPRYHYFEYDEEMRPAAVGWYMVSPSRDSLELRVSFDTDGMAVRYEARYDSGDNKIKSVWEGTPENVLTVLNRKEVANPAEADPQLWEPVFFE